MAAHQDIRHAHARDLEALVAIEAVAFESVRRSSRRALRRALSSDFQRVLVAELDGRVAGMMVLWPYRHTWRIYNLATHPDFRNRGIAGALLARAVAEARAAGDYYGPGQDAVRMALPVSD